LRLRLLLCRVLSVALIVAGVMVQTANVNGVGSPGVVMLSALLTVTGLGLLWVLSVQQKVGQN